MATQSTSNWMAGISDNKLLSELSIPGSHDTMTYNSGLVGVKTQNLSLQDQLNKGIRKIDIRVKPQDNLFYLVHGSFSLGMEFGHDVLDVCTAWLNSNPSECIVMTVVTGDNSAEKIFQWYLEGRPTERFYLDDTIPALGAARGKIVLLREFPAASVLGIDSTGKPDNADGSKQLDNGGTLVFQNIYDTGSNYLVGVEQVGNIANAVANNMALAYKDTHPDAWYLNGNVGSNIIPPHDCAIGTIAFTGLNPSAYSHITQYTCVPPSRLGTILLDFFDETFDLVNALIATNGASRYNYDLESGADQVISYDHDSSGKPDHLVCYRPGVGNVAIYRNNHDGTFTCVYWSPGGVAGYDMKGASDRIIGYDYNGTGHLDHLVCYRPGSGNVAICHFNSQNQNFVCDYWSDSGIGGYDVRAASDQITAYDYNGTGHLDHLVCYRPGNGVVWILEKKSDGSFNAVYNSYNSGGGIGG